MTVFFGKYGIGKAISRKSILQTEAHRKNMHAQFEGLL